jgi:chorismate dehydratase
LKPSVCAVSFLNTTPLIWGMQYGPERELVDLTLAIPSECASRLAAGSVDCGLVPVIELIRQPLRQIGELGIVSDGAVRSILLISKVPFHQIRTLAVDASSRTSVMLAKLVLRHVYGAEPELTAIRPDLTEMLVDHDAALVIGDPALRIKPDALPYRSLDLGAAWTQWTGLPMVFAVWATTQRFAESERLTDILRSSYVSGQEHLAEIINKESAARDFAPGVVKAYLTSQIHFDIAERERQGQERFLELAKAI